MANEIATNLQWWWNPQYYDLKDNSGADDLERINDSIPEQIVDFLERLNAHDRWRNYRAIEVTGQVNIVNMRYSNKYPSNEYIDQRRNNEKREGSRVFEIDINNINMLEDKPSLYILSNNNWDIWLAYREHYTSHFNNWTNDIVYQTNWIVPIREERLDLNVMRRNHVLFHSTKYIAFMTDDNTIWIMDSPFSDLREVYGPIGLGFNEDVEKVLAQSTITDNGELQVSEWVYNDHSWNMRSGFTIKKIDWVSYLISGYGDSNDNENDRLSKNYLVPLLKDDKLSSFNRDGNYKVYISRKNRERLWEGPINIQDVYLEYENIWDLDGLTFWENVKNIFILYDPNAYFIGMYLGLDKLAERLEETRTPDEEERQRITEAISDRCKSLDIEVKFIDSCYRF